jgi:hypothetical protein
MAKPKELPAARSMTMAEVKKMRKDGRDPAFQKDISPEDNAAFVDWILSNIYPTFDFDEFAYAAILGLAKTTYQLTYGSAPDEKN